MTEVEELARAMGLVVDRDGLWLVSRKTPSARKIDSELHGVKSIEEWLNSPMGREAILERIYQLCDEQQLSYWHRREPTTVRWLPGELGEAVWVEGVDADSPCVWPKEGDDVWVKYGESSQRHEKMLIWLAERKVDCPN